MDALLRFARYFATIEHVRLRGHTHNGLPYTHHLMAVEQVLRRFFLPALKWPWQDKLLVAAWLHDIIEDSNGDIKSKHIAESFDTEIADLVFAVTKEPGTRKQSWPATAEKIRDTPNAVLLKLADRIANLETGGQLVQMYVKEHDQFVRQLAGARISGQDTDHMYRAMWEHYTKLIEAAS